MITKTEATIEDLYNVPVAPEMVFRLASITKQFTAVAVLMLVQEDKVALSDEITRFLPAFPTQGQTITVEHLLTHTAGVKNYVDMPELPNVWRKDMTLDDLIGLFQDQPLGFAPGEQWAYSDSGYVLLGAIIEKVSGMSYAEFIQQRIFTPLGMTHSYYDHTAQIIPGRVAGYARGADGFVNAPYLSMSLPYAAGALGCGALHRQVGKTSHVATCLQVHCPPERPRQRVWLWLEHRQLCRPPDQRTRWRDQRVQHADDTPARGQSLRRHPHQLR